MFGRRINLFKVAGIPIGIDASWFIIAVLLAWSLGGSMFPAMYPGLAPSTYWTMGIVGALALFISIVLHELGHATVAQRYGMRMRGITLFLFGGVAEMTDEPPSPKAEFAMAIAGPIVSLLIAAVCYFVGAIAAAADWPVSIVGVLGYLAVINGLLVAFNLIPGFPLDGGRVLRSALWKWKDNLRWATRVTSTIGSAFGIFLIVLGVVAVLRGQFIGGMWWFLIGMFLRTAAQSAYQQVLMRETLRGEPIRRFMKSDLQTVSPHTTVYDFVEDHLYRHHHKMFPVLDDDRLVGCVGIEEVRQAPREEWHVRRVGDVMGRCSTGNTISPDADAMTALVRMNRSNTSRLMVVEGDRLVGMITLRDLMSFLSLKLELERESGMSEERVETDQDHAWREPTLMRR